MSADNTLFFVPEAGEDVVRFSCRVPKLLLPLTCNGSEDVVRRSGNVRDGSVSKLTQQFSFETRCLQADIREEKDRWDQRRND